MYDPNPELANTIFNDHTATVERRLLLRRLLLTFGIGTALKMVGFHVRYRRMIGYLVVAAITLRPKYTTHTRKQRSSVQSFYGELWDLSLEDLSWLNKSLLALSFLVGLNAFPALSLNPDAMDLD